MNAGPTHLQLDPVGGCAGDMFVAALLDAFPEHEAALIAAVEGAAPVRCRLVGHNDGVLQGRRFLVEALEDAPGHADDRGRRGRHGHAGDHGHDPHHGHHGHEAHHGHDAHPGHGHRRWAGIRADLAASSLAAPVRDGAIAIFTHLARAEAKVHGIDVEAVAFHEVGAWDSIADIVAAAFLIDAVGKGGAVPIVAVSALPLGSGRVRTAHGLLPVPAPATALLLEGFETYDDGVAGERVTPTGAAILRHLCAGYGGGPRVARRLVGSGIGFGARRLSGVSNCLRVLVFAAGDAAATGPATAAGAAHRDLLVVEFEVDDQSAEELATGLDRLRAHADVFDVVQMPVFGKKGRMMTHVRLLARLAAQDEVVAACFRETTTIGLRHRVVSGSALPRRSVDVEVDGLPFRVKCVDRPGGRTAKAESDDVAHRGDTTHAVRARLRREAERRALERDAEA